jgi:hypothetical protein
LIPSPVSRLVRVQVWAENSSRDVGCTFCEILLIAVKTHTTGTEYVAPTFFSVHTFQKVFQNAPDKCFNVVEKVTNFLALAIESLKNKKIPY